MSKRMNDGVNLPPVPINGNSPRTRTFSSNSKDISRRNSRAPLPGLMQKPGRSETTSKLIDGLMSNYNEFDSDMRVATMKRRDMDELKLFKMKEQLGSLERDLNAEIKYRQEMTKSVRSWILEEIGKLAEHCEEARLEQQSRLEQRFNAVRERIDDLEERFENDKVEIPREIRQRGEALKENLHNTVVEIETEEKGRLSREAEITRKLAEHEATTTQTLSQHRTSRSNNYGNLQSLLEDHIRNHMKSDEKFKAKYLEEVTTLKNNIVLESQERERHDLELASALNRHITQLQASLKIVNSTNF